MKPEESLNPERGLPYPRRLYLTFTLMALVASLGLDYLAARRGEKSYIFPRRVQPVEIFPVRVRLADLAGRLFAETGIPPDTVQEGIGEKGSPQLNVRLSSETYLHLAPRLEDAFRKQGAVIQKDEKKEDLLLTYSWVVQRGEEERLTLQFSCPLPAPAEKEVTPPPPPSAERRAAIIIDDMGNSLEALQEICDLHVPLTISVLPQSPYAMETAQTAHDNHLEVMLHLPGESVNHQEGNPAPIPIVRSDMSPDEIVAMLEDSLGRVPYATGVNNHMGSKITQEEPVMRPILGFLKEKGLFFVDSRTVSQSIAYDLAQKMGVRSTFRNVFLDSEVGVEFSRKKLVELFKLAQKKRLAVGIGHPFPETLQALKNYLPLQKKYGVSLVFVTQVIRD